MPIGYTPNYNLPVAGSSDNEIPFIDFRTAIAGTSSESGMMKIDSELKILNDTIQSVKDNAGIIFADFTQITPGNYIATVNDYSEYKENSIMMARFDIIDSIMETININNIGSIRIYVQELNGGYQSILPSNLYADRYYMFKIGKILNDPDDSFYFFTEPTVGQQGQIPCTANIIKNGDSWTISSTGGSFVYSSLVYCTYTNIGNTETLVLNNNIKLSEVGRDDETPQKVKINGIELFDGESITIGSGDFLLLIERYYVPGAPPFNIPYQVFDLNIISTTTPDIMLKSIYDKNDDGIVDSASFAITANEATYSNNGMFTYTHTFQDNQNRLIMPSYVSNPDFFNGQFKSIATTTASSFTVNNVEFNVVNNDGNEIELTVDRWYSFILDDSNNTINFKSGGTGGLDITVVGGTTKPVSPKENTIWISTDLDLNFSDYKIGYTQPVSANVGDVFFKTEDTTAYLYADKNKQIEVRLKECWHKTDSEWIELDFEVYSDGEWRKWYALKIINDGILSAELGSFVRAGSSDAVYSQVDDYYQIAGSNPGTITSETIDYSSYKTMLIEISGSSSSQQTIALRNGISGTIYARWDGNLGVIDRQIVSIDLSDVSEVANIFTYYPGTLRFYNIWLIGNSGEYIDYLQSSGTQWIDTGVVLPETDDFQIEVEFMFNTDFSSTQYVYGARGSSWTDNNISIERINSTDININNRIGSEGPLAKFTPYAMNTWYKIIQRRNVCYVNNVEIPYIGPIGQAVPTNTLYLFAGHGNTGEVVPFTGRIKSLKIVKDDGNILSDLKSYKDSSGILCMRDSVNNQNKYNLGTGEFISPQI